MFSFRALIATTIAGRRPRRLHAAATQRIPTIAEYHSVITPILENALLRVPWRWLSTRARSRSTRSTPTRRSWQPDLWLKVLSNTRAGLMPAEQQAARSPPPNRQKLERWIKYSVFKIDPRNPDPGRVTVRRLNRVEYRNTVRDLLGVDYNTDHEFPPDDTGFGFDNIGDALTISPMLMEKYVAAAQTIVAEAVPTAPRKPDRTDRQGPGLRGHQRRVKWGKRQLVFSEPANVGATFKTASRARIA